MCRTPIDNLLAVASDTLAPLTHRGCELLAMHGDRGLELESLLRTRNGFFAFESALHVRHVGRSSRCRSLDRWNDRRGWIVEYDFDLDDVLFFAEDIFGEQFGIQGHYIVRFDPETAQVEVVADHLQEWARLMLDDRDVQTGFPLAHAWQCQHGAISEGRRLAPRVPFVCGGEYIVDNLVSIEEAESMRWRAQIANQIRDVPDGGTIEIRWRQ